MKEEKTTSGGNVPEERLRLYRRIEGILTKRGIKGCTMDLVAAQLGMSKRTLYEIFGSKEEMLIRVTESMQERLRANADRRFRTSDNMMEAMVLHAFDEMRLMQSVCPEFFRDLRRLRNLRRNMESRNRETIECISQQTRRGVEQGVFRTDVNYPVTLRLIVLQYETLACMHDVFPPDVTLAQAYETITLGFLRSIATPKGMQILDELTANLLNAGGYRPDKQTNTLTNRDI